jgi:hypothetical protein
MTGTHMPEARSGFGPAALGVECIQSIFQNIVEVGEVAFDEVVKRRRDVACRSGYNWTIISILENREFFLWIGLVI